MAVNLTNYNNLSDKEKKEYEEKIKKLYIILGIATVLFYVLPFCASFAGVWIKIIIPILLVLFNTLFVFMSCFIHSRKHDFGILIPSALAVFFIPTVIIFYKDMQYLMFPVMYFVIGMFGEFTGHLFIVRKKNKRQPFGLNRLVNGQKKKEERKAAKKQHKK